MPGLGMDAYDRLPMNSKLRVIEIGTRLSGRRDNYYSQLKEVEISQSPRLTKKTRMTDK